MLETAESQINKLPSLWKNITTQRDFNTLKFVEILTASDFPEVEARKWVDDRYPLTRQVLNLLDHNIRLSTRDNNLRMSRHT